MVIVLGIALAIVGRPIDALVSLAVISTNIVVSVTQEVRAKRTLDRIALLTRPTARVVRDGAERDVTPEELVLGDLVTLEPGDQVVLDGRVVDGRLQLDESQLTGESDLQSRRAGEVVYSGSFATDGYGRYVVEQVGEGSLANRLAAGARAYRRVLTPLQREIQLVIRLAFLVVGYLEVLLLFNALLKTVPSGDVIGQAAVLVGLIPNGLFVSIAIAYALGAVRIARQGALVQHANAIESLSSVDVLCLDKTGTLTANRLTMVEAVPFTGTEATLRDLLGTMVASSGTRNKTAEAIAAACPGSPVPIATDIPFSSARKWSAIEVAPGVEDAPLRGIVALGAPQMLEPYLTEGPGIVGRAAREAAVAERSDRGLRVLLLAGDPAASGLVDAGDATILPSTLVPIGIVALEDELRAEAGTALAGFRATGVRPVIISGDDPDTVAALARQAGLGPELVTMTGPAVDELSDGDLAMAVGDVDVFGRITPSQKERLVGALKAGGHYVGMIGDGVNDVLSLKKADLGVAMHSGSAATRAVADIILTDDSFASLLPAVSEGQRIRNGMGSILALFLTRISTLGVLIVSSLVIGIFPIGLRNASVVSLLTVGIPSTLLALWAQPGAGRRDSLRRTVFRVVAPATILSSVLGLGVLYGTLALGVAATPGIDLASGLTDANLTDVTPSAQSALTLFLVLTGLALIAFVEPPLDWLAVAVPRTSDRRPLGLAVALAAVLLLFVVVGPARALFGLAIPSPAEATLALGAVALWILTIRLVWRYRLMERFLGL